MAEDEPSDSEEQIPDGAELNFLPSDKECMDSKTTPDSNVVSVRLSQVDIKMLSSTSGGGQESCSLLGYDEVIQQIPPLLATSWSMKFFPRETEVPFNQHPQHNFFKKCAILNKTSQPQPDEPAVSSRFQ